MNTSRVLCGRIASFIGHAASPTRVLVSGAGHTAQLDLSTHVLQIISLPCASDRYRQLTRALQRTPFPANDKGQSHGLARPPGALP
eukprot:6701763-Prymnesium_polylepis.1